MGQILTSESNRVGEETGGAPAFFDLDIRVICRLRGVAQKPERNGAAELA